MATDETSIGIGREYHRIIDELSARTGKSKRRLLWEMTQHYVSCETNKTYLDFEGVDIKDMLKQIRVSFNEALSITV